MIRRDFIALVGSALRGRSRVCHKCILGDNSISCSTMLRKTIYATLIVIPTMGAAFAQADKPGLSGYNNLLRSGQEKNQDVEIDRAYRSTIKRLPDTDKKKS